ncbi:uncharacterized protein LOC129752038 [Uranotaenia lowii]|uniref:uncharacterized protein LOC129752038 n=1 Tax=Uranotaenia lowii TaxID=190385 RepID=UPI002479255D|nr:uncharacterized protein LOC129752038 [Uranotaenia lowii]
MSPSPGEPPDRTIPEWMDPLNLNGRLQYITLKAADGHNLPQNPFIIGRSVEKTGKIEGFYETKNSWYVIKSRNKKQISELEKLTNLTDGTPIVIGRHPSLNQRKCVVTCREVDQMNEKDLLTELSSQNVIDVRRITKKTPSSVVGTSTLILTINGTVIPEFFNFGFLRVRTRLYYPLPLLCRNCLKYGHTKKKCESPLSCTKCSSSNHDSQSCKNHPFCGNCQKEGHSPINRSCPIWIAETTAIKISTERNMPIAAARKLIQQTSSPTSFANVVKVDKNQPSSVDNRQAPPLTETKQKEEKTQQQQPTQQKRTNQPTTHLKPASPPRKRITPQPSPAQSSDEADDRGNAKGSPSTLPREQLILKSPIPSQRSLPSPYPFQPPPSLKKTPDPRPTKTYTKK